MARSGPMSDIFISYRRGTASPYARGIYERLESQFGSGRVFMDIDTMEPGVDFVEYIEDAVSSCQVLIVVVSPDWLAAVDETGRRRMDDPDDFVRVEVATALARDDVRVIPVLVAGAAPPAKGDLPEDLAPLTRRHALEITDGRWDYDLGVLARTVGRVLAEEAGAGPSASREPAHAPAAAAVPPAKPRWPPQPAVIAIALVAVAAIAAAAVLFASGGGEEDGGGSAPAGEVSVAIPTANPCRMQSGWMVTDFGAEEHHECELTTSPPPENLELPSLVYGRFSDAAAARGSFDEGLDFEYKNGAESCRQSSLRRMEEVFPQGDTACFIDGESEYISMWWNEDRSPVIGNLQFANPTQPEDAVAAWERVVSAG
jgi:hypothetical protein